MNALIALGADWQTLTYKNKIGKLMAGAAFLGTRKRFRIK